MVGKSNRNKWHSLFMALFAFASVGYASVLVAKQSNKNEAIPTEIVEPLYPREAVKKGIQGWVKFNFDLSSEGKPQNLSITESKPKGTFDKVATKAIKQWKFKANSGNSKNLTYTLEFKLAKEPTKVSMEELALINKELKDFRNKRAEMELELKKRIENLEKSDSENERKIVGSMKQYISQLNELIKSTEEEAAYVKKELSK